MAKRDVIGLAASARPACLAALKVSLGFALISWALVRKKAAPLRGAALALGLGAILWPL